MLNVVVGVLVDGVYGYMDGDKMRARPGAASQLLSVAGGAYVQGLVGAGMVTLDTGIGSPAEAAPAVEVTPAAAQAPSKRTKGR